jgi:hypothetical protein
LPGIQLSVSKSAARTLSGSREARIAACATNRLSSLAVITAIRRLTFIGDEKQFKSVWERSALSHQTPPSETKFAKLAADWLETIPSQQQAMSFFYDLQVCANGWWTTKTSDSVRALCLSTALDLGERFPNVKPESDNCEKKPKNDVLRLCGARCGASP